MTVSETGSEPGSDFLTSTRVFYDAIAEDYAALFEGKHAATPLDRAILAAFAELVGGEGTVADVGCGPGRSTAHLASLGLRVYGLDLSESMLAVARRENPDLRFEQGSMLDLDVPDGVLPGSSRGTRPSTPLWTNCPRSSPSSTGPSRPAATSCSPSRPAARTAATTAPSATTCR